MVNECRKAEILATLFLLALLPTQAIACTLDSECDDSVSCTVDTCFGGVCSNVENDALCDDSVACTQDTCDAVSGCSNVEVQALCDDSIGCTDDVCDPILGCLNTPDDTACDDGVDCTDNVCDPALDCQYPPDHDSCSDFLLCTEDICDPLLGCLNPQSDCDDLIDCTIDSCDPATGCLHEVNHSVCTDAEGCTLDLCDPDRGCVNPLDFDSCPSSLDQSSLFLDVGYDQEFEWYMGESFEGPMRINLTDDINRFVRGGCWCSGCFRNASAGTCCVPIALTSDVIGNFTIDDPLIRYKKSAIIQEVGYANTFRINRGGCWDINCQSGSTGPIPVPQSYLGGSCSAVEYHYDSGFDTDLVASAADASVDAVFRLINNTLDLDHDGVIDYAYNEENISFHSEGQIGVQSLWGPLQVRLVVWS